MTLEQIEDIFDSLSDYGPLPGFLLPFLEAFLPFLPLMVIIAANVNIYGILQGILLSWLGSVIGSTAIFLICKKYGARARSYLSKKFPLSNVMFGWIEKRGFSALFIVLCFPFTPSILVTLVAGLSQMSVRTYVTAMMLGKAVMITCISILSFDLVELVQNPLRIAASLAGILLLWYFGKKVERRYQKNS